MAKRGKDLYRKVRKLDRERDQEHVETGGGRDARKRYREARQGALRRIAGALPGATGGAE